MSTGEPLSSIYPAPSPCSVFLEQRLSCAPTPGLFIALCHMACKHLLPHLPSPSLLAKQPDVPTARHLGHWSSHGVSSPHSSSIWSLISLQGSSSSYKWKPSLQQQFDSPSVLGICRPLTPVFLPSAHQNTPTAL